MESFGILQESLSQSCCLCHVETRTLLEQLDLASLLKGQGLDEKIMSNRDETLVRLGLITSFAEMNHCSKLKQVQQALCSPEIFELLESMMSSTDQSIAYCASKCLAVLLQKMAKNDKDRAEGFLRQAIVTILHPRGDFDQGTSSIVNKTVFTFDLFSNLLREESTKPDDMDGDTPTLSCLSTSTSAEDKSRSTNLTRWYLDAINGSIQELCAVFSSQSGAGPNKHGVGAHPPSSVSWIQSLDISSKHKICHAFMRLLYSFTKIHTKRESHSTLPIVQSIVPHLQALLMNYCHGNVANLKMVLSVLILCVKSCVKAFESAKHSGEVESDSAVLQQTWRSLLADICERQWLEKMPYHEGPVGFGGALFASGDVSKESSEEYSIGDRTILRKLAWLVILSSQFEAVSTSIPSRQGFKLLEQVSCFIVSKLRGTSQGNKELLGQGRWIFEIFGDQDDALIGIMLSLLKIDLSAKAHQHDKENCKSSYSECTQKDEDVCEFGDEILAEDQEKCIHDVHHLFISFLDHMTWDHSILLDLLISTETDFLEYFTRYLRFVGTDWEGFVGVQRLYRKKEEGTTVPCQMLPSDADSSDDDDDDDGGNLSSGDSDGYDDDDIDEDVGGVSYDVDVGKEFNEFMDDANVDDSKHDVNQTVHDNNRGSDNEINAAENQELHGQSKLKQIPKPSENFPVKRKFSHEETNENAVRKIKSRETESQFNVTLPLENVKGASCKEFTVQAGKDEDCITSVSELGCLDDTMTILIRLRLAIERLEKRGLFPFSATPLIRLLVNVEDMYENVDG